MLNSRVISTKKIIPSGQIGRGGWIDQRWPIKLIAKLQPRNRFKLYILYSNCGLNGWASARVLGFSLNKPQHHYFPSASLTFSSWSSSLSLAFSIRIIKSREVGSRKLQPQNLWKLFKRLLLHFSNDLHIISTILIIASISSISFKAFQQDF